tara:strand:- start:16516 stop:16677 length:162 start_codon:yes stop_codon:yes gene_type:complete
MFNLSKKVLSYCLTSGCSGFAALTADPSVEAVEKIAQVEFAHKKESSHQERLN